MGHSNFVQSDFRGGEWSPFSQGRIDDPLYKTALNICRNGYPIEEGAWVRRSGSRFCNTTRNGGVGRLIKFDFEQKAPYQMEFTDGHMRLWTSAVQSSILANELPLDMVLATTNDDQDILAISSANPAVVQTKTAHGWATGDQTLFLFDRSVAPAFCPLLQHRVLKITVTDGTHYSLSDALTGTPIDGSALGWAAPVANTVIAVRINDMATPYAAADLTLLRSVQAEKECIFLHGSYQPELLSVVALPTASSFATFKLAKQAFTDGPYLDAPTDGSILQPTVAPLSGQLPSSGNWSAIAWSADLSLFCTVLYGTAIAATSPDGITWTQRTLPIAAKWTAIAWKDTVTKLFCAVAEGGTIAATSPDGINWTQRTLPVSSYWSSISWNGTVFCAVSKAAEPTSFTAGTHNYGSSIAATSTDGITWTQRALPIAAQWSGITWSAGLSLFCAVANHNSYTAVLLASVTINPCNIAATSADGITWTQRTLPTSSFWNAVAWNGTVFSAIAYNSNAAATSTDGITWVARTLPSTAYWDSIAWNVGEALFMATSKNIPSIYATSPDGITWTQHTTPGLLSIAAVTSNGTIFCLVPSGSNKSLIDTGGVAGILNLSASTIVSINNGKGFIGTDVGRAIRLRSEPLPYFTGTAYVVGNSVVYNDVYYTNIQNGTNKQPDVYPTYWQINVSAATWTWGTISVVTDASNISVVLNGPDLLYSATQISNWRLAVYSDTTGYPTCGLYYEGRLWLAGAIPNRIDGSKSNDLFNMAPTDQNGTVADNNGLSYTFNSTDVNPIFWLIGTQSGIIAGTQGGEWEIRSTVNSLPITPTNIQAHLATKYGCANVEPEHTELTISFVHRFQRKVLEYFPDVFSGRYTAPNLSKNAKHLTQSDIQEIRYQKELAPILWARMGDGSLIGATYKRTSMFSTQGPEFCGWHRHDLGSGRTVHSISVGPSVDDNLDTLSMVTLGADGVYHVELFEDMFDTAANLKSAFMLDNAIVPSGAVITGTMSAGATITFYGLWHLNGKAVSVSCGGIDCGDATVSNGAITVPVDVSSSAWFTTAYLASISSLTAYGEMTCPVKANDGIIYYVPAVVGFNFTSQGQTLRPDMIDQVRSSLGPGSAKPSRIFRYGAMLSGAGVLGVSFGTDFVNMHQAQFRTPGGRAFTSPQLYSGVYADTLKDDYSFDSMIAWQITRPYPCSIQYVTGFMDTVEV